MAGGGMGVWYVAHLCSHQVTHPLAQGTILREPFTSGTVFLVRGNGLVPQVCDPVFLVLFPDGRRQIFTWHLRTLVYRK